MNRWHPEALDAYVAHAFHDTPEGVSLKLSGEGEAEFYLRSGAAEVFAELESMPVQALLITGDDSDVRALAEAQHAALPHAELRVFPDCGHFIPQEKPAETAAALRDWFAR
jgi:pimeloyl-ACP methyl ester carboxylesterase